MRVKILVVAVVLATAIVPTAGSASAEPPFVNHFKGRAAQAILTDCELGAPDGTACQAVDIFVSDETYQERGVKYPWSVVYVQFYDIIIDSTTELGFIPTLAFFGISDQATVSVAPNLSSASVQAEEIYLFPCNLDADGELVCECEVTPDDVLLCDTTSIDVAWTATGKRTTTAFHARGSEGSLSYNFHAVDSYREATASGVVGGQQLHDTPLFLPSIFTANNGLVERFSD